MAYRHRGVLGLDVRLELAPSYDGAYVFNDHRGRCRDRAGELLRYSSEAWPVGERTFAGPVRITNKRPLPATFRH